MKKVLLVATVQSHICQFHLPLIDMLHEEGYEVHVAAKNNLSQKKGLKYDIIHCNTPMGGFLARVIGKKYRKKGMKIIYTAHGFHFFKGAPKLNWILYYPIEKYLSKYTDCLITMNIEDYEIAKNKFHATKTVYTHGIGLNTKKFEIIMTEEEKNELRQNLGLKQNDFVMIYVAELTPRKNHYMILNTMKELKKKKNIKILLVGNGPLENEYKKYIEENNLEESVKMLGYRIDIPRLMKISNIAISTSRQEGLPVNVMEAMKSGLPDIVTNCRGNRDLIENGKNGYVIENNDKKKLQERILELYNNSSLVKNMGKEGITMVKPFEIENVIEELRKIYENI